MLLDSRVAGLSLQGAGAVSGGTKEAGVQCPSITWLSTLECIMDTISLGPETHVETRNRKMRELSCK